MATYTVHYNGRDLKVELHQTTSDEPEFLLLVRGPEDAQMLAKTQFLDKTLWIGGGSRINCQELGEAIENAIGFTIPVRETNNPFEYRGDRAVRIESFKIEDIVIERAKAPFNADIYFRIVFPKGITCVMAKMRLHDRSTWNIVEPLNIGNKEFRACEKLLKDFEKAYRVRLYQPVKIVQY